MRSTTRLPPAGRATSAVARQWFGADSTSPQDSAEAVLRRRVAWAAAVRSEWISPLAGARSEALSAQVSDLAYLAIREVPRSENVAEPLGALSEDPSQPRAAQVENLLMNGRVDRALEVAMSAPVDDVAARERIPWCAAVARRVGLLEPDECRELLADVPAGDAGLDTINAHADLLVHAGEPEAAATILERIEPPDVVDWTRALSCRIYARSGLDREACEAAEDALRFGCSDGTRAMIVLELLELMRSHLLPITGDDLLTRYSVAAALAERAAVGLPEAEILAAPHVMWAEEAGQFVIGRARGIADLLTMLTGTLAGPGLSRAMGVPRWRLFTAGPRASDPGAFERIVATASGRAAHETVAHRLRWRLDGSEARETR